MKTGRLLAFYLSVMALLIVAALIWPARFLALMQRPDFYLHAKLIHVLGVTLFFANAVIGTIWELRGLLTGKPEIIRHTFRTVTWLDAVFVSPLIIVSVLTGILMSTVLGGVWEIGWVSVAFLLFFLSGLIWIAADIPTQYRINRLFAAVEPGAASLPPRLTRLIWIRMGINAVSLVPLLFIFFLMIHKPDIPRVDSWLDRCGWHGECTAKEHAGRRERPADPG